MKGKPKFEYGDLVDFQLTKTDSVTGTIYIVDKFGTFDYPYDVSYDIMSEDKKVLYKHIPEKDVKAHE